MRKWYRRHTGLESGLSAAAGDVCMAVNQARDEPPAFEIDFLRTVSGKLVTILADSKNPARTNQDMTNSEIFGSEDSGIGKQLQQGSGPGQKKGRYTTLRFLPPKDGITQMMSSIPLGKETEYPQEYAPEALFPVARSENRSFLGIGVDLPFHGSDLWNAWELTWLNDDGKPVVATATFEVPVTSPNIIESKSLKLYLGSFAMSRFGDSKEVRSTIADDLSDIAGEPVSASISTEMIRRSGSFDTLPGECIDDLAIRNFEPGVDPGLLAASDEIVEEALHSHLLRSHCPVTNQPDSGSVLVRYRGPKIDPAGLLAYIVSFRQHNDFHEACVERMFVDIQRRCRPEQLTVYARYNRRGGIDINPFRSDFEDTPANLRLWRQ